MLEAKETNKVVTFRLSKKDNYLQDTFKGQTDTVTVRLAVIELQDGKKEILCTSLIQTKKYTHDSLKQLYHFRWGIEEAYKLFKVRADLESFSGLSALSVKQDFYAAVFSMNICAAMSFPIEQKVRQESKEANLKYTKTVNKTNVLSMVRECMSRVFIRKKIKRFLSILDNILTKTTEFIRSNRSFPRNHKQKKPKSMNYKKM